MLENFTLMYVEDDVCMQEYLKAILKDKVKKLYQAKDGIEGLEIYKEHKPDIILSDVYMDKLNGLEMTEKIKEINRDTPIIILSGFDDKELLIQAINVGVDYFIPKPINVDLLLNRLNIIAKHLQTEKDLKKAKHQELLKLKKLAHYDILTKIPNRLLFDYNLEKSISKAKRGNYKFALFFIDLDDFKKVNDTYGHKAGDLVLKTTVTNIQEVIRKEDILARMSGDEFAMIIENIKDVDLGVIADKIITAVSQPITLENGVQVKLGCSVGISIFPTDAQDKKELIHCADIAMYEAKKNGKSSYKYYKNLKG